MKWLWNWAKPKIQSVVDNSQIEELRNQLTTLQNNINTIQNSLNTIQNNYVAKSQSSYSFNNGSDNFVINVPNGKANYVELKRNNVRKTTMGIGSSASDTFSIESTGNIKLKPTGYVDMSGYQIQNVGTPTTTTSAVTKQYVDNSISSFTNEINNITSTTNTNTNSINNLTNRVSSLENRNSILSTNNVFTGVNTFNNPINVGYPTSSSNAATKGYVDSKLNTSQILFYTKTFTIQNASNFFTNFGTAVINAGVSGYSIINAYISECFVSELNGTTVTKKLNKSYIASIINNQITISTSDNDSFNFNSQAITLKITCVYVKSSSIGSL